MDEDGDEVKGDDITFDVWNAYRWESQIKLIGDDITKWMTNLNVELKDLDLRYSSQIAKTRDIIDNVQLKKQIELEHDKIDQWNVNEKRNIIVIFLGGA